MRDAYTFGPGSPIPVSPGKPGGPGRPLSPFLKNAKRSNSAYKLVSREISLTHFVTSFFVYPEFQPIRIVLHSTSSVHPFNASKFPLLRVLIFSVQSDTRLNKRKNVSFHVGYKSFDTQLLYASLLSSRRSKCGANEIPREISKERISFINLIFKFFSQQYSFQ